MFSAEWFVCVDLCLWVVTGDSFTEEPKPTSLDPPWPVPHVGTHRVYLDTHRWQVSCAYSNPSRINPWQLRSLELPYDPELGDLNMQTSLDGVKVTSAGKAHVSRAVNWWCDTSSVQMCETITVSWVLHAFPHAEARVTSRYYSRRKLQRPLFSESREFPMGICGPWGWCLWRGVRLAWRFCGWIPLSASLSILFVRTFYQFGPNSTLWICLKIPAQCSLCRRGQSFLHSKETKSLAAGTILRGDGRFVTCSLRAYLRWASKAIYNSSSMQMVGPRCPRAALTLWRCGRHGDALHQLWSKYPSELVSTMPSNNVLLLSSVRHLLIVPPSPISLLKLELVSCVSMN